MRHSTADQRTDPRLPGWSMPPLVRPDERSTAFAHPCPRRCRPAHRRVPATGSAARPRRLHRRRHRRTDPPLHHRPRTRRRPADRLQDPPRLPLPALRRGLPRRHLPAHPGRADRRQGHPRHRRRPPVRLRHADRAVVRPGPRPPGERRPGARLPTAPEGQDLPARHRPVLRREAFAGTTTGSASRCARTATTTPGRSCSTPAPPNCGAGSPSPSAGPWPARPGSPARPSPRRSGSPTPRSPNTSGAASSTSTPSSGSTAPPGQPTPRPAGPRSPCSPPPSTRPPAPSASPRPPHRGSRPARWPGAASSTSARSPPAAT